MPSDVHGAGDCGGEEEGRGEWSTKVDERWTGAYRVISAEKVLPHNEARGILLRPVLHHLREGEGGGRGRGRRGSECWWLLRSQHAHFVNTIISVAFFRCIVRCFSSFVVTHLRSERGGVRVRGERRGWRCGLQLVIECSSDSPPSLASPPSTVWLWPLSYHQSQHCSSEPGPCRTTSQRNLLPSSPSHLSHPHLFMWVSF